MQKYATHIFVFQLWHITYPVTIIYYKLFKISIYIEWDFEFAASKKYKNSWILKDILILNNY